MEALGEIMTIDEVIQAHVLATVRDNPDVAKWKLSAALGIHPNTLAKLLKRWAGDGESVTRDRR